MTMDIVYKYNYGIYYVEENFRYNRERKVWGYCIFQRHYIPKEYRCIFHLNRCAKASQQTSILSYVVFANTGLSMQEEN